eukprot:3218843-Lingulodinium_polyedra.AAC.1
MHQALVAPATFLGGGPAWRRPSGSWSRCDYVLLPRLWLAARERAFTDSDVVLALDAREDRRAAFVE